MINLENRDSVALLRLNRGTTNALSLELVEELAAAVGEAKADPAVRGVVLAGSNEKFLSIGFDLPPLVEMSREEFKVFYHAFNRMSMDLFTLPKPTVAAIGGHAIAGGCILALCCDYRLIAAGRRLMGLNEIKLGVPVPFLADCILRDLVGTRHAREIMESGDFYEPEESLAMGLVDRILPAEEVLEEAVGKARSLGSMPEKGFEMIKRNRTESIEREVQAQWVARQEAFMDCWFSEEARRCLREAMQKF
jgi:enoyl-CoA hydratase/carnithine racemase